MRVDDRNAKWDSMPLLYSSMRKQRRRRVCAVVAAVLVFIVLVSGINIGLVLGDVNALKSQASTLSTQLATGDEAGVEQSCSDLEQSASSLHAHMSSPYWAVLGAVPVLGDDIRAASSLSAIADDACGSILSPVLAKAAPYGGNGIVNVETMSINVDFVSAAINGLGDVQADIQRNNEAAQAIGATHNETITKAADTLKAAFAAAQQAAVVGDGLSADQIAALFGKGSPSRFLLVAQNNAELRSVGGFPGSVGLATFDNGTFSLGEFKSVYDTFPNYKPHVDSERISISDKERTLFSKRVSYIAGDVGQIVDFERTAEIWHEMWLKCGNEDIAGIVAIDPVFLQYLLGLTNGFTASNGWQVDGTNAAELLLNKAYIEMPVDQTDAFYASVASQAFTTLTSSLGSVDASSLVTIMNRSVSQGHFFAWMNGKDQQKVAEKLGISGGFTDASVADTLGVYVSDYTWSKYGWYLDRDVKVGSAQQNSDGTVSYDVTLTLSNLMTQDELSYINSTSSDPAYILGYNTDKRTTTDMVYLLYVAAPENGSISNMKVSSGTMGSFSDINLSRPINGKENDRGMACTTYQGRQLWGGATLIDMGESTVLNFTVTVPEGSKSLEVSGTTAVNPSSSWAVEQWKGK